MNAGERPRTGAANPPPQLESVWANGKREISKDHDRYARASQRRKATLFQSPWAAAAANSQKQEDREGNQARPQQQVWQPGPPWIVIQQGSHDREDSDKERRRCVGPQPPRRTAVGHAPPSCAVKSGVRQDSVPHPSVRYSLAGRAHDCLSVVYPSAPQPHQSERGPAGTTVKAAEPSDVAPEPFAQVSGPTAPQCPQLPKLMARLKWSADRRGWGAGAPVPAEQQAT